MKPAFRGRAKPQQTPHSGNELGGLPSCNCQINELLRGPRADGAAVDKAGAQATRRLGKRGLAISNAIVDSGRAQQALEHEKT